MSIEDLYRERYNNLRKEHSQLEKQLAKCNYFANVTIAIILVSSLYVITRYL